MGQPGATSKDSAMPLRQYNAAGGVVVCDQRVLVLVRPSLGEVRLPKGHIESGETPAEAALREVREESGFTDLHIQADLGTQIVAFDHQGYRIIRREHYFLMGLAFGARQEAGETEFEPEWLPWQHALENLTFETEREWVRRAIASLRK